MTEPDLARIVKDPALRFGAPTVRGTRLAVEDVVAYLASGGTEAQLLADFPQLTEADVRACLAWGRDPSRG